MADDAAAPTYTNDPSDPSTWSSDYAAKMQAAVVAHDVAVRDAARVTELAPYLPAADALTPLPDMVTKLKAARDAVAAVDDVMRQHLDSFLTCAGNLQSWTATKVASLQPAPAVTAPAAAGV